MKKIYVMLSSYNGEKYISEQINSILNQRNVTVELAIRDDGSSDRTVEIIKKITDRNECVHLIEGNNVGFRRSFYSLLLDAPEDCDYYAFSDQDDFWEPMKLGAAVEALEGAGEHVKMYASGLKVVDQDLNYQYLNSFSGIRISYGSALSRQRLAGCTMVFSPGLLKLCKKFRITEEMSNLFSHDAAVYYICLACGGKVVFEPNSYIQFRRHKGTVTERGKGYWKRIKSVLNVFNKFRDRRYNQAKLLLETYREYMPEEIRMYSLKLTRYRDSLINTLSLLIDKRVRCGIVSVDVTNAIAIITQRY